MGTSDAAKAYDAEGDRTRLEAPSGTPSRSTETSPLESEPGARGSPSNTVIRTPSSYVITLRRSSAAPVEAPFSRARRFIRIFARAPFDAKPPNLRARAPT